MPFGSNKFMKAISCPQCGSLIKHLSLHQPLAGCDYCGARLMSGDTFLTPVPFAAEAAKFQLPPSASGRREPVQPIFTAIFGIVIFTLLLIMLALFNK